jgi:hypothetical protein
MHHLGVECALNPKTGGPPMHHLGVECALNPKTGGAPLHHLGVEYAGSCLPYGAPTCSARAEASAVLLAQPLLPPPRGCEGFASCGTQLCRLSCRGAARNQLEVRTPWHVGSWVALPCLKRSLGWPWPWGPCASAALKASEHAALANDWRARA